MYKRASVGEGISAHRKVRIARPYLHSVRGERNCVYFLASLGSELRK